MNTKYKIFVNNNVNVFQPSRKNAKVKRPTFEKRATFTVLAATPLEAYAQIEHCVENGDHVSISVNIESPFPGENFQHEFYDETMVSGIATTVNDIVTLSWKGASGYNEDGTKK
jgi:hypothetical protein